MNELLTTLIAIKKLLYYDFWFLKENGSNEIDDIYLFMFLKEKYLAKVKKNNYH